MQIQIIMTIDIKIRQIGQLLEMSQGYVTSCKLLQSLFKFKTLFVSKKPDQVVG
jgi:hypothetical protein